VAQTFTITDFFQRFPTDDSCLDHLMKVRYGDYVKCPKCGKTSKFARIKKIPAYSCPHCGHHIHPMAGTPFERSRTPLQKWFYAMYLFTTTRNGVAAKELQRQLGVTYKCAWRIGHEIRKYMAHVDGDTPLGGREVVEADEAFLGGRKPGGHGSKGKTVVFGMVERDGDVIARVVKSRGEFTLVPHILENVKFGSKIATDEFKSYKNLPEEGYLHGTVNHSQKEYVRGPVHTNTIEGFWSWMKRQIEGTHVWVSPKHLPKYLGEMEFRFNLRKSPELMFPVLIRAFHKPYQG